MIYIYKINADDEIKSKLIDTWDNGKFKKSSEKMDRDEVINTFNNGYMFTSDTDIENDEINFDPMGRNPSGYKSKTKKISINKSELIKAINPESTYALIPRSHNKENLKFENESVKEMSDWIKKCEKDIVVELERFYD